MGASHGKEVYADYSRESAPGSDAVGLTRRHPSAVGAARLPEVRLFDDGPQVATMYEAFSRGVFLGGGKPCAWERGSTTSSPFESFSFNLMQQRVTHFGSGLLHSCPALESSVVDADALALAEAATSAVAAAAAAAIAASTTAAASAATGPEGESKSSASSSPPSSAQPSSSSPVSAAVNAIATGVKASACVGLYASNSVEWIVADQACHAYSLVTVPVFDLDTLVRAVDRMGLSTVVADEQGAAELLMAIQNGQARGDGTCASVKDLVVITGSKISAQLRIFDVGVRVRAFAEMEAAGRASFRDHVPPCPDEACTIIFGAGAGAQAGGGGAGASGIVLSHRNMTAALAGLLASGTRVERKDLYMSNTSLAHVHERVLLAAVWCGAGSVAIPRDECRLTTLLKEDDVAALTAARSMLLFEDLATIKPSLLSGSPALFRALYDKIIAVQEGQGPDKARRFRKALASKMYWLRRGWFRHGMWDGMVFDALRKTLGLTRMRLMFSALGPLDGRLHDFVRAVVGCPAQAIYGSKECAGFVSVTSQLDFSRGHVGGPLSCCEVRLVSEPGLGYSAHEVSSTAPAAVLTATDAEGDAATLVTDAAENKAEVKDSEGSVHSDDSEMAMLDNASAMLDSFETKGGHASAADDGESKISKDASKGNGKAKAKAKVEAERCVRGMIYVRGPNVFAGHWNDGNERNEGKEENKGGPGSGDGWLATGDLGEWMENGELRVIGRMDEALRVEPFVPAEGDEGGDGGDAAAVDVHYVVAESIQQCYRKSLLVSQIFVTNTESTDEALVAVVVPDEAYVRASLGRQDKKSRKDMGGEKADIESVYQSTSFKAMLRRDMDLCAERDGLKDYARVLAIAPTSVRFTPESGFLTPSFKIRRSRVKEHFRREIIAMGKDVLRQVAARRNDLGEGVCRPGDADRRHHAAMNDQLL